MSLDPQNIPISLSTGIDTKSSRKQLQGKLIVLQNATFNSPGEIEKRDGFTNVNNAIIGGGTIGAAIATAAFQNELTVADGASLYSYSPTTNGLLNKGPMSGLTFTTKSVIRNQYNQTSPDSAYNSGFMAYTWNDSGSSAVNYSIVDATSNNAIVFNQVLSATATKCKVIAIGVYFVFFYYDSSNGSVSFRSISTANIFSLSGVTIVSGDVNTTFQAFDAHYNSSLDRIYVAWATRIAHQTSIVFIGNTLVVSGNQDTNTVSGNYANVISVMTDGDNNAWVSYNTANPAGPTAGNIEVYALDSSLNVSVLSARAIAATRIAKNMISYITGVHPNFSCNVVWEETAGNGTADELLIFGAVNEAGTIVGPSTLIRGVGLASKAFAYNGNAAFMIVYNGTNPTATGNKFVSIEPTYFIYNTAEGPLIAKIAPGNAGGFGATGLMPEVISKVASQYEIPYLLKDDLSATGGGVFFNTGVQSGTFSTPVSALSKQVFGNNLHFSGGQLWAYDGQNVVEHGFHIFPENLSAAKSFSVLGGGTGLGPGASTATTVQFQYVNVYEWQDNQGQIHKSAPSPAITVNYPVIGSGSANIYAIPFTADLSQGSNVLTAVSSFSGLMVGQVLSANTAANLPTGVYITALNSGAATITLSQPANATAVADAIYTGDSMGVVITIPTLRCTNKTGVTMALYRTEANETVFYRVSSLTSPLFNNISVDSVTFNDQTPDSQIIGNEQLYTTGGEVDNLAAPAISAVTNFKNRMVYLPIENSFQWGYSKEVIPGSPVEFNSLEFVENVNQSIGNLSAFYQMDDKLILFGPSKKFYVAGDGPTPAGTNDDFTQATEIIGTTGCTNQASLVKTPVGLFYQDPVKGIWLLDRSLQEQYVGADVEAYNAFAVTSTQLFENSNRVIFTLSTGTNLVYDYYVKQWETDIFASGIGAFDSTIYQNDLVYVQANGIIMQQSPTLHTDNGAFVPMSLTTNWFSFAGIEGFQRVWELQILGTWKSPHTLTVNIYTDFGTTPVETVTIPALTQPSLYQFRIKPKGGKCETMQIQIIESQTGSFGEGLSISNLAFRVGVKRGLNKLPAGASY